MSKWLNCSPFVQSYKKTFQVKIKSYSLHLHLSLYHRVVGTPQITSQPVSSIFLCSLLPSGTWQTPGLSIRWCCLSTSYSVCIVFFPLSLHLAGWFWPDLMNGRHVHTTSVWVLLDGQKEVSLFKTTWKCSLVWVWIVCSKFCQDFVIRVERSNLSSPTPIPKCQDVWT